MLRTAGLLPPRGFRRWAKPSLLPGLLAATRTGLTPAGDDKLALDHELHLDLQLLGERCSQHKPRRGNSAPEASQQPSRLIWPTSRAPPTGNPCRSTLKIGLSGGLDPPITPFGLMLAVRLTRPIPKAVTSQRCEQCDGPMPEGLRAGARYCRKRCRQADTRAQPPARCGEATAEL